MPNLDQNSYYHGTFASNFTSFQNNHFAAFCKYFHLFLFFLILREEKNIKKEVLEMQLQIIHAHDMSIPETF